MRKTKIPYCDVDLHPPADTPAVAGHLYSKNMKDLKAKIYQLEADNAALRAQLGDRGLAAATVIDNREVDHGHLLVSIADALHTGELFANESSSSPVTDRTRTGRQVASRAPKGGDPKARSALRQLVGKLSNAIDVFESRQLNDWERPVVDFNPPGPRDRCWTRGCDYYARWFTGSCPGCGKQAESATA